MEYTTESGGFPLQLNINFKIEKAFKKEIYSYSSIHGKVLLSNYLIHY